MARPNCYNCSYRRQLPGDTHSSCAHPKAGGEKDEVVNVMFSILASAGRLGGLNAVAAEELGVTGSSIGIRNGWFNWPYNYDPIWLITCDGFMRKEV